MRALWDPDLYNRALWFAGCAHGDQRVPGTQISYLLHLSQVCQEAMGALVADEVLDGDLVVACALLHDVAEDTDVTVEQVADAFGEAVAQGVDALTKRDELGKAASMTDSLRRIRLQPPEIWVVKLADRITNLQAPPAHWSSDKVAAYRVQALQIHDALGEASQHLKERLNQRIEAYPPDR